MSKPIEPGCSAVITKGSKCRGLMVTVGRFLGTIEDELSFYTDAWEIDIEIPYTIGPPQRFCPSDCLRRIDDDYNRKVESWSECVWQPDSVKEKACE